MVNGSHQSPEWQTGRMYVGNFLDFRVTTFLLSLCQKPLFSLTAMTKYEAMRKMLLFEGKSDAKNSLPSLSYILILDNIWNVKLALYSYVHFVNDENCD